MQPPAAFSLWSSPPPEVRFDPPSEDEMASWLCAIVRGEELAILNDDDGRRDVPAKGSGDASTTTDKTAEKLPVTAEAKGTKKRRRHKINERLKTLQQLVPGCYKSNQVSTLDQTIKYMKSLQHHVQAMSIGPAHPAAAAMYPVVPSQYVPPAAPVAMPMSAAPMVLGQPPTMVSFGAMLLPLPRYPAAVPVMMPAAAAPPRAPGGARSSASHQQGSSRSKGRGSSSMRHQKQ
ncbi:hypothetical protein BAE44_0002366 [Dichanthelium oligosanthes]|uniref:BHLH domain-containing protein n=1 Tax=Dichanthelium oligosanthes TaxID=888268 RepID=A0A1E5WGT9_9POAL|nr:hypothetical protein BAE44_0002366 [Dichanthelium oligosanthes]